MMNNILLSILHPSRNRSSMAFETAKKWAEMASDKKNIQYILSIDNDEPDLRSYENNYLSLIGLFGKCNVVMDDNKNVVQAMNIGARMSVAEIIVGISDDFLPPENWDLHILSNIDIEKEQALQINDGLQPMNKDLLTMPIITRKLYNTLNFIYPVEFSGIYADNWLGEYCAARGILKKVSDKIYSHLHWVRGHYQKDSTNMRHDCPDGWRLGERLIAEARKNNYGIIK